jgi:hypothetical protein
MTSLRTKTKNALDESHILSMVTTIFIGFIFKEIYEKGFSELNSTLQIIKLIALASLIISFMLLISCTSRHRVKYKGEDSPKLLKFIFRTTEIAMLPFSLSLALDLYICSYLILGQLPALIAAAGIFILAMFLLYGLAYFRSLNKNGREN